MKILLPFAGFVFASGTACCCCGDFSQFNPDQFGVTEPPPWEPVPDAIGSGVGPGVSGSTMAPIGAFHNVSVLDISSEDAYYSDKATIVGKRCVTQEETSFKDGGWHGGSVNCPDGSSYYFYKAALADNGATAGGGGRGGGGAPAAGIAYASVPSGTRVKLLEVSSEDAYFSDKATIVGKHGVTEEATSLKDGGWHGGSIRCNDGSSYYFYKVQIEVE